MKYTELYLAVIELVSMNSFDKGLNVTDFHLYVKVPHCRFKVFPHWLQPQAVVVVAWSSTALYHTVFTNPHPSFSGPIKSEEFSLNSSCDCTPHMLSFIGKHHSTEAKDSLTTVSL